MADAPQPRLRMSRGMRILFLTWLLAGLVALGMYLFAPPFSTVEGRVEVIEYKVSSVETGRVREVLVNVGQRVSPGHPLVRLDTSELDRQVMLAEAELEQEIARRTEQRLKDERAFADAVERYRSDLARERMDAERDKAALEGIRDQIRRWQDMVDSRVAPGETLAELKAEAKAIERRMKLRPKVIKELEDGLATAIARLEAFRTTYANAQADSAGSDPALSLLRARIASLKARRDALVLRAPADTLVHRVLMHEGDVARPGDPVVVLRSARSDRVLAYVSDAQAKLLKPGYRARLIPRDGSLRVLHGRVLSIGSVLPVPNQLMRGVRGQPWGVEVAIGLEKGSNDLFPGQVVDVSFERTWDGSAEAVGTVLAAEPAPNPAPPESPIEVHVPASLAIETRIEPSGLVWIPELAKYLVVSDDTGPHGSDAHPPWVLLMDRNGSLAPHPTVVEGISALNDVESVTRSPDATIWLLSSQTTSKRGNRPESRTALVRAKIEDRRLVATGRASLASALAQLGDAKLDELGLVERDFKRGVGDFDRLLDIEGMTAFGDSLLLGLRRPLDSAGRALLWRLSNPGKFVETGRLDPSDIALVARLDMAHSGCADLVLLPDQRLAVLGVAIRPEDGRPGPDSALYVFDPPIAGTMTGKLVRTFSNLHAEGIALAPEPQTLTIIFDRNRESPLWLQMGVP